LKPRTEFDLFLDRIRPFLLEYLQSKGYKTQTAIRCLNPKHEDKTASMLCTDAEKYGWKVYCTSCGFRGDIFDAYAILEDKPTRGPKWLNETVLPLALMFDIPAPVIELSAEQQFENDLYRVYEEVASMINHRLHGNSFPTRYVLEHQWTEKTLADLDIGVLRINEINSRISLQDRIRFELNRPDLFNEHNLIFTVRDFFGRPVKFFARRPNNDPKFISTKSSNLLVDVWRDRGCFYLSHLRTKEAAEAIIVEGHPDAVTLYQNGFKNVNALCGCKRFSETHLDGLIMDGILRCILAYDGDKHGQEAVLAFLQNDFVKVGGVSFEVIVLPNGSDPDLYIRKAGKEKFEYLLSNKLSAFEFLLSKQNLSLPPEDICAKLIPYISATKSSVSREIMARALVNFLGGEISIGSILSDASKLDDHVVSAILERKKSVINVVVRQVKNNVPQAREIFRDAVQKLDKIEKEQESGNPRLSCLARLASTKMLEEHQALGGYTLKKGSLGMISDVLEGGDWMGSRVVVVGGVKNVGKSTFIDNFIWEAVTNPDNNAIAYLLTIDDPIHLRFRRMCACALRDKTFTQNMIANPAIYSKDYNVKGVYEKRDYAYSQLTKVISSGKLIIEDTNDGNTLVYAERRIEQLRRDNPNANIIFGLDNFHNCADWSDTMQRDLVGTRMRYAKRICEIYKVLGLFSAEYRKLADPGKPGTDDDLADCLEESTKVVDLREGHLVRISKIQPGAVVQTFDEATQSFTSSKVTATMDKGFQTCIEITLDNGYTIEGTLNHPLLRIDGKWTKIRNLKCEDKIAVGPELRWKSIQSIQNVGIKQVYDIEVSGTHNFLANNILCHNSRVMSYDPSLTMHLYSDLDYLGKDRAILVHRNGGDILPRILINIGKNKITSFKGSNKLLLDFFPASAFFEEVSLERARRDAKRRQQEVAENLRRREAEDYEE
jgi:DNA primase